MLAIYTENLQSSNGKKGKGMGRWWRWTGGLRNFTKVRRSGKLGRLSAEDGVEEGAQCFGLSWNFLSFLLSFHLRFFFNFIFELEVPISQTYTNIVA